MQITFNNLQEQKDWQDFCERLSAHLGKQVVKSIDRTDVANAIELLREMQERWMTFE